MANIPANKTSKKIKIENRLRGIRDQLKRARKSLGRYPYKDNIGYVRLISRIDEYLEFGEWNVRDEKPIIPDSNGEIISG